MAIGGRLGGHSVLAWSVVWHCCDGFRLPPLPILRKLTKIWGAGVGGDGDIETGQR